MLVQTPVDGSHQAACHMLNAAPGSWQPLVPAHTTPGAMA
jgi:hypothetical protein